MLGIAASPGIAMGKLMIRSSEKIEISDEKIKNVDVSQEINKLEKALLKAETELKEVKKKTAEKFGKGEADIFAAHLSILNDPELKKSVEQKIEIEKMNAESAVAKAVDEYSQIFTNMEDEYMQARAVDIKDVGERVLKILLGKNNRLEKLTEEVILAAEDLTPSDTAQIDTDKVKAFLTRDGSRTSHTAIMARSLGIPAIVGLGANYQELSSGQKVIVDGDEGKVLIDPTQKILNNYQDKLQKQQVAEKKLEKYLNQKAQTATGEKVEVVGNIGNIADAKSVIKNGGEGIGLFRTEFLYMNRQSLPTEEEQYNVYKEVAELYMDKPVLVRTLDIGGDKDLPYLDLPVEMNPFLGYRAIRMTLDKKDIFKTQLRAILRASQYGNLKIMFPMISSLSELQAAKKILNEVRAELDKEKVSFAKNMKVGIMIEVPAAVVIADLLAEEVDFFSIGTNDLIQYTVAVDRTNEKISKMHTPYHPAVLRLIRQTIESGHRQGIWVGMCGEAAADELLLPFLLGAGLDEFSMSAFSILKVKELLTKWTRDEAVGVMHHVLRCKTIKEVKEYLQMVAK